VLLAPTRPAVLRDREKSARLADCVLPYDSAVFTLDARQPEELKTECHRRWRRAKIIAVSCWVPLDWRRRR
jgi:hypothetical protein